MYTQKAILHGDGQTSILNRNENGNGYREAYDWTMSVNVLYRKYIARDIVHFMWISYLYLWNVYSKTHIFLPDQ